MNIATINRHATFTIVAGQGAQVSTGALTVPMPAQRHPEHAARFHGLVRSIGLPAGGFAIIMGQPTTKDDGPGEVA